MDLQRRRLLFAGCAAAACAVDPGLGAQDASDPDCRRCRGLGVVPRSGIKPYVFTQGQVAFKPEEAAVGQPCPLCQARATSGPLIKQASRDHTAANEQHAQWEERLGEKLLLIQTRHAAIHTQLKPADARRVGEAVEEMAIRLQRAAGSLALTPTRPASYEQMLLWGEPVWLKFRAVMESLFTPEQLGDNWQNAGKGTLYDHIAVAHCYLTPKMVREVSAEYFAVKLAATRQIQVASGWKSSAWLHEGFAAYAQHLVLSDARVFTIYALDRGPGKPVTLKDAARQAGLKQFRPWEKLLTRDLRDFETSDYLQSLALVAFLLEDEPAKFVGFVELLKAGTACPAALAQAYGKPIADLETARLRWLAS